jgi:type IV pilus assembly protein PilC
VGSAIALVASAQDRLYAGRAPQSHGAWHNSSMAGNSQPMFGKLTLKLAMSRFTRTFGILLRSGIPVLMPHISSAVVNNTILARPYRRQKAIREGADIAGPLKASDIFPLHPI